jgi:hypothetical protein
MAGEFVLADWEVVGLNIATAVKQGLYTVRQNLVVTKIGRLTEFDAEQLE